MKYDVVHHLVYDKLKAKLKVPRPVSVKQPEGAIETFKKKLPQQLEAIVERVKKFVSQGKGGGIGVRMKAGWDCIQSEGGS